MAGVEGKSKYINLCKFCIKNEQNIHYFISKFINIYYNFYFLDQIPDQISPNCYLKYQLVFLHHLALNESRC